MGIMRVGDFTTYGAKSSIKAGAASAAGRYKFFTSSSEEDKRCDEYQFDCEGIIMGTGGNATLHYFSGKFAVSTDCVVLFPDERVRCKYLYYFFLANISLLEAGFKGAGLRHTNKNYISNIEFGDIPPISKQEEIIAVLDSVLRIQLDRKKALRFLNTLIKARFVEMFGTLERPAQDFTRDSLKNLCNKITDGKHGGCTPENGTGRYFVGAREIYDDMVHYDTAPQINVGEFEKDYKRCNVEKGDFLIVNTGATIGKSAIAIDERTEHTLLQKSVALLKTKRSILHPVFLKFCYIVNDKMYKVESASAQPNLLLSKINATEIYVPPMPLQEEFATFVTQVDKSKSAIKASLDQTQMLFDSLMQEYFG